ncbi:MAG: glutamine amidotransferase [Rhodospirillales bacterium]|nr:glutamine amidotransferase [Rhodospirillales bacterium]
MKKRALAIRHVHFEDLGTFDPVFEAHGYDIAYADAGLDDLSAIDNAAVDLLIVLGGPIGAYEEDYYPFLVAELELIRKRLAANRPILGLCLGAQLMARALGADVRPGPAKEIGWGPVSLTEAGWAGPLKHLGSDPVLHWHGDAFTLPDGAERLAGTEICPNQAFSYGPNVLAFQFHPEAAVEGFESWLIGHAVEIAAAHLSPDILRREAALYGPAAAERGRLVITEWLAGL